MGKESRFNGREEKRLPIMMEVNLRPLERTAERRERTYTDNISAHGVRVRTSSPWQLGEQAEITPVKGEASMSAEVVYCQKLGSDRFFVGLRFRQSHNPWSVLQRFSGSPFLVLL
jgi:PilZ domain-containing protein